jgi:hypothetical protein
VKGYKESARIKRNTKGLLKTAKRKENCAEKYDICRDVKGWKLFLGLDIA